MRLRAITCWRLLALACLLQAPLAQAVPSFGEVRQDFSSSETRVLSREGELLQRVRTDSTVRRGDWVALGDVSAALRTAMLLSEDKRFYEHSGVDWAAVTSAAWGNLWNQRTRGASTISMQLAGLLDGDWRRSSGGRSVGQKVGQTVAAQVLDRRWQKTQILEAYLNLVPFRGELVGIDALSRTLFDKAPHGLDDREAAVAAALVRAPNARPSQVGQRACGVLKEMRRDPKLDCEAIVFFTEIALKKRAFDASEGIAPHFSRIALREARQGADGKAQPAAMASLRTTLSAPLQRYAVDMLGQHLQALRSSNVQDGAVLVLDNASGEVLAWVGSSGALSQAHAVDAVLAPRQPGSTLKPFLYGQAIAEHKLTAASLIEDSPARIPTASGLYIPQNYDRSFKGWVSVRTALGASLNVPAVRTLVMVGVDDFFDQLVRLGMPMRESGSYFGYSLALGSPDIPLVQLTNAYRALANGGRYSPVAYARGGKPQFRQAMDAGAAYVVGDMLADGNARVRTFGLDSVLGTRSWAAVKTGTSKDMRDNWAVGWSDRYTVGVWVGNASGEAMHSVSGTSGAAPVWASIMGFLHQGQPSRAPKPPAGLQAQWVDFGPAPAGQSGAGFALEARREEWFLAGTAQPRFALDGQATGVDEMVGGRSFAGRSADGTGSAAPPAVRILAPANGTIVAVDPDIPPERQRLQFVADSAAARWRIDGKDVARGARWAWLPWPGRHQVELVNAQGEVLDSIRLEVRGAGVKQAKR
ncbi:penicillin-binding protein 1C [Comamonas sp. B-9]|uniref:penicillin-binding protein 1C n=1 Tax=Comamonas sp. B-9 TaxID=1055192 RepID=UPI000395900D|nr:penicillin-binding protein 1C [Comamonas sp. B-9]